MVIQGVSIFRFTTGPKILVDFGNMILDELEGNSVKPGASVRMTKSPGGTLLDVIVSAVGSTIPITPFKIFASKNIVSGTWDGTYNVTLYPGTVNEFYPSNIFSTINQAITATTYVILTCSSDGYRVTTSSWALSSSPPTVPVAMADLPPGTFYVTIGIILYNSTPNTITIFQNIFDDILATPSEWTRTTRAGAGPFELAYVIYYAWSITS